MVAFATDHARQNAASDAENRVWKNFFVLSVRVRENRPAARQPRRVKAATATKTASGVRYYGFRYYSPSMGRWLNRDPINEAGSMLVRGAEEYNLDEELNLYAMVRNDPVNHIDRLGLDRWHVDQVHTHIVVETYDCCCNKTGYAKIEFGPRGALGLLGTIGTGGLAGPGEVTITTVDGPPSGINVAHIPSTCEADWELLYWATMLTDNPPWYSFWVFNCRHFSAYGQNVGIRYK